MSRQESPPKPQAIHTAEQVGHVLKIKAIELTPSLCGKAIHHPDCYICHMRLSSHPKIEEYRQGKKPLPSSDSFSSPGVKHAKSLDHMHKHTVIDRYPYYYRDIQRALLSNNSYPDEQHRKVEGWTNITTDAEKIEALKIGLKSKDFTLGTSGFRCYLHEPDLSRMPNHKLQLVFKGTNMSRPEDIANSVAQGLDIDLLNHESLRIEVVQITQWLGVQDHAMVDAIIKSKETEDPHSKSIRFGNYYKHVVEMGKKISQSSNRDKLEMCGHSLGGGLAQGCAHAAGCQAAVFNATALHENTVPRYKGTMHAIDLTEYVVSGDAVALGQVIPLVEWTAGTFIDTKIFKNAKALRDVRSTPFASTPAGQQLQKELAKAIHKETHNKQALNQYFKEKNLETFLKIRATRVFRIYAFGPANNATDWNPGKLHGIKLLINQMARTLQEDQRLLRAMTDFTCPKAMAMFLEKEHQAKKVQRNAPQNTPHSCL
jgi:hypothetical protein